MNRNWRPALRQFLTFCAAIARRFQEERATQTAGSLAYTSLLSMVPLLTVALAIASAFPVFENAIDTLQTFLFDNVLPDAPGLDAVTEQIDSFTRNAGRLTAIGIIGFMVTSVMLMLTIDNALNRIFRVQRRRSLVQNVIIYWAVLTLAPVLIGVSLSMTTIGLAGFCFPHSDWAHPLKGRKRSLHSARFCPYMSHSPPRINTRPSSSFASLHA